MISGLFQKFLKVAWFLPGFLLWAAYPPMGERMDVLFALAPLMWFSRRTLIARDSAKRWFQSGCFYWVATLSWMPAIVKNGGPWPLVVLGWIALAAYCALYFWLYGWLSANYWIWARQGKYGRRLLGVLLVEPVLWCGLELIRSRFLGGFSWNQLGVVPINSGFGAPAMLGGVYLCSAVVILINGTIAGIVERMWKPERSGFRNLKRLGVLETMLAFAVVFGIYKAASGFYRAPVNDMRFPYIKVALVQRNFPCCFKEQEENPYEVYDKLIDNASMLYPDLVVLPESAMSEFGPLDQQGAMRFADWVARKTGGASLLAGGSRYSDGRIYNSAALYDATSTSSVSRISFYDKVHLVPFGEFIPGDKTFKFLQKFAPVGSCTPGELKTLDCVVKRGSVNEKWKVGVAICFEDTDSYQMRELALRGAQVLFFITNDSWFSHSIEAEQHAWQAVARAVETGLTVVRVGNSGVTGTIAPNGKATWLMRPDGRPLVDQQGTMLDRIIAPACIIPAAAAHIPIIVSQPAPLYVYLGDIPLGITFALLITVMFVIQYRSSYEKRRTMSM